MGQSMNNICPLCQNTSEYWVVKGQGSQFRFYECSNCVKFVISKTAERQIPKKLASRLNELSIKAAKQSENRVLFIRRNEAGQPEEFKITVEETSCFPT